MKFVNLVILVLVFASKSAVAEMTCSNYLAASNLKEPLMHISKTLKLPFPKLADANNSSKNTSIDAFIKAVEFFKHGIESMKGAPELFNILQRSQGQFPEMLKHDLAIWAKTFLPGYEFIYADQVKAFPYKNTKAGSVQLFFDERTGVLDDSYLFELYAHKKIPLLNIDDLISVSLLMAQPNLRQHFELAIQLYQRAVILGDLSSAAQLFTNSTNQPFADKNRLEYLATLIHFLLDQIAFISTSKGEVKLILWGAKNLKCFAETQIGQDLPKDFKASLDLSLYNHPIALSYFVDQSGSQNAASVLDFFNLLVLNGLLPVPPQSHLVAPREAHGYIHHRLHHFEIMLISSNFEATQAKQNFSQAWDRLARAINLQKTDPLNFWLEYSSRLLVIKYYLQIANEDITSDEAQL